MAANKDKIVAQAQRYTEKGQFEKAVAEYRKILKSDPQDIRTNLKIGDLYTRMGARKEATETYNRVAEQYTHSGFHLKAIAVYKQVLNIDPTLSVTHQYLAASYLELGLTSEALIQLEQLADVYERTSKNEFLLEVLLQMGKIDPRNIATRLRIAELLSKEKRTAEAAKHFLIACQELKNQGRKDDFAKVAERLLYHDPSRTDIAMEIASIYLEKGLYKEALSKLQVCFVSDRRNTAVLDLLAKAFLGLGQLEKAVSVMQEAASVFAASGDYAGHQSMLESILSIDPNNNAARSALGKMSASGIAKSDRSLNKAILGDDIAVVEDEYSGVDLLEDLAAAENLSTEEIAGQSQKIVDEVKVLLRYGKKERAFEHLNKVFEIDPYNIDGRETACEILLSFDRKEEALEHLFLLADVFKVNQPEGSIYYLHEILKHDKNNRQAKKMIRELGGIMPEGIEDSSITPIGQQDDIVLLDEDDDVLLIDDDDLVQADAVLTELDDLDSDDIDNWNISSAPPPSAASNDLDNEGSAIDLINEVSNSKLDDDLDYLDDLPNLEDEEIASIPIEDDDSDGEEVEEEVVEEEAVEEEAVEEEAVEEEVLQSNLELATESKISSDSDNLIQIQNTTQKEIQEPQTDYSPKDLPQINDDLEEINFFIEEELWDEASAAVQELLTKYPTDPRLIEIQSKIEFSQQTDETTSINDALNDVFDSTISAQPSLSKNTEGSVQFKNVGIKEKLSDSDSATTWDLGLAYKEMGLFEDAIQAFHIAARDVSRTAAAKTMIGICYASLSQTDKAVETFNDGLNLPGLQVEQRLALLYELGNMYQMISKNAEALKCYKEIVSADPKFADVASRIGKLGG